jgi:hypothetical protein
VLALNVIAFMPAEMAGLPLITDMSGDSDLCCVKRGRDASLELAATNYTARGRHVRYGSRSSLMSTIDASLTTGAAGAGSADDVTAQRPIMVYTCNRLGRVANPPSFSFADWFRSARRR